MERKDISKEHEKLMRPSDNLKESRRLKSYSEPKEPQKMKSKFTEVPKLIFVVPYRDRENQVVFFQRHMKYILEDYRESEYEILICHQNDKRSFNCGAMKNIGFLIAKKRYPRHYQDITFIFNDVDTLPFVKNTLQYETTPRNVKHFYGFTHTLGGIVSIRGADFESLNGFPNFWAWGYEDNLLYDRALRSKMRVDRDNFFEYADKDIMHFQDGYIKKVNKGEFERYAKGTLEGIHSIYQLTYHRNSTTGFYDIDSFVTTNPENIQQRTTHDLHNGTTPFRSTRRAVMSMRL